MFERNRSFNPLTCGQSYGFFARPLIVDSFAARNPYLIACYNLLPTLKRSLSERTLERAAKKAIRYATNSVTYRNDAGGDKMELPRLVRSDAADGSWTYSRVGDCEDICAGQKDLMIKYGVPGERILYTLCYLPGTSVLHMMLTVVLDAERSFFIDNRRSAQMNESYDFLAVEQSQGPRWAWTRETNSLYRYMLQVDADGNWKASS